MAKALLISKGSEELSFTLSRIDRSKIYGARKRIAVDGNGRVCTRAALTGDGRTLLLSGMTSQGYFTDQGRPVLRSEMVGLDALGHPVESNSSTLGIAQTIAEAVAPSELLSLALQSVFYLKPEQLASSLLDRLKAGEIFKVPFNYSAGFDTAFAYIIANDDGCFALVGKATPEQWVEEGQQFVPLPDDSEEADDLDFDAM